MANATNQVLIYCCIDQGLAIYDTMDISSSKLILYCPQAKSGFHILKRLYKKKGKKGGGGETDALFSRGPESKYFGFVGYMVSIRTAHLCHHSTMTVTGSGHGSVKFYLQKDGRLDLTQRLQFANP